MNIEIFFLIFNYLKIIKIQLINKLNYLKWKKFMDIKLVIIKYTFKISNIFAKILHSIFMSNWNSI